MTPDIERLAKEAGLEWLAALAGPDGNDKVTMYAVTPEQLAKFANLMAEECIQAINPVLDEWSKYCIDEPEMAVNECIAAIRAKFALSNDKPEAK